MKKILILLASIFIFSFSASAKVGMEFGLGSGYVFYGDEDLRSILNNFDESSQIIACADFNITIPLGTSVFLTAGADSILDGRWNGGNRIILVDYCSFAGFTVYPGLAGFNFAIDYCLGRRTDFVKLPELEEEIHSTYWGNGFAFGLGYNFGYGKEGCAPEVAASWRRMPRGNDRADNILEVKFRLKAD